ncbi:hypothetical protein J3R30DRAFT_2161224 [Lentinula aciculospora]|uniref:C3H1-type domain-containing protein n=1 Tax=Lentinula aciculospora TaxID=153920 RepID=A0A9W9AGR4_9AGAR|nr:hypothetical protein J3R30DRAFT_2161224 [Lentinula aciculospora]
MTVNQPKKKDERKRHTKPCKYFQTGTCPLSAALCDFAHIFSSSMPPDVHHSAQFCRFYDAGYCRNGNNCRFRHDPQHYLPVALDPNWINTPRVTLHEANYMPSQYISAYATPPTMLNPICYPPPFWAYESYPQYSPPPPPSHYYPTDFYTPVLQPDYNSRHNSTDSSSITSSLTTASDYPHATQVIIERDLQGPGVEVRNRPEYIVTPLDHDVASTLFSGSSGIAKAKIEDIQAIDFDNNKMQSDSSKPHSKAEHKPYKIVRCKFHRPPKKLCPKGGSCTFIHTNPLSLNNPKEVSREGVSSSGSEKTISPSTKKESEPKLCSPGHTLPPKPLTHIEAERQKGHFAVTWRVISGGVQMGVNKPDIAINLKSNVPTTTLSVADSVARLPVQSLDHSDMTRLSRKRTLSSPSRPTLALVPNSEVTCADNPSF